MPINSIDPLAEKFAEMVEFYMSLKREDPTTLYYSATFSKCIYRFTRYAEQYAPELAEQGDARVNASMVALSELLHKGLAQRTIDGQGRIVITSTDRTPEVHAWEIGV